jgi:hypothetical protein
VIVERTTTSDWSCYGEEILCMVIKYMVETYPHSRGVYRLLTTEGEAVEIMVALKKLCQLTGDING